MPKFSELADELSKCLDDITEAKEEYEALLKQTKTAQEKYLQAVANAQEIKNQVHQLLDISIPSVSSQKPIRA